MSVRAKFIVDEIKKNRNSPDSAEIILKPVTSGSTENDLFYKYTPYGSIVLGLLSPEAANQFFLGDEFFVDFTRA